MPQRKEYVLQKMKSLGLNFLLFDAIKPDDLTYNDYSVLTDIHNKESKIFNGKTKVGCGFSHLFCYLDAVLNNYKNIIVFEDDIKINVTLQDLKNGIQEFLKSDFKLFFMGYCFLNCNQKFNKSDYKYITGVPDRNLICRHSIAIKIESIIPFLENIFPFSHNGDLLFVEYIKKNKINVCVPYTPYFIQNEKLVTLNGNPQNNLKELEYCNI
jgi:GR25 family glycosyltransferase involved in LPS biosynthesis